MNVTGGPSLEELAPGVPELIARWRGWRQAEEGWEEGSAEKRSQAEMLIEYAEDAEVFHTPDETAYATFRVDDHEETWPVESRRFELFLRQRFFEDYEKAPKAQALKDALATIVARAIFNGPEQQVFLRVAGHEGAIYVNLCNERWEAVEVTLAGWRVVTDPPVRFVRTKNSAPLPRPVGGGSMEDLRPFVRARGTDFELVVAWLVGAFRPTGPYPLLEITGEQGTAKSTAARVLRSLVDPAQVSLRALPTNERDLAIAASANWVLAFDNLSYVRPQVSDAMCRLSTGGGFGTRALYTDDEEALFDAMRAQIVNGINRVVLRGDLQERSIEVTLLPIPKDERRAEREFWAEFETARPKIFGALLDAVSAALRNVEEVRLEELPRMADFAVWVTASEEALGWEQGAFMAAYCGNQRAATEAALEADPVAVALTKMLELQAKNEWRGTSEELLEDLGKEVSDDVRHSKAWPKAPNALSRRLNRLAPLLREVGIEYEEREEGREKKKIKVLRKIDDGGSEGTSQDDTPPDERPASDGGDAPRSFFKTYEGVDDGAPFNFNFGEDEEAEGGSSYD
ncbi:MAG TPA: hypothetical protein VNA27_06175 [Rubrobacteraceae bacterium]|nr:hypothetical protein [Rubrobacteraceae bacterium]